jgi:undecaprenyl diphosphate synthase
MNEQSCIQIEIKGRVQGVHFRSGCKKLADGLGIKGKAENLSDGTVEIIAIGAEHALRQFLAWIHRASPLARIDSLSYRFVVENIPNFERFEVIRRGSFIFDQVHAFKNLTKELTGEIHRLPHHVVIIPDGNRRWAQSRGLAPWEGHRAGIKNFEEVIQRFREYKIPHLTLWGFSTENWKRENQEVQILLKIFREGLERFGPQLVREKVRFRHIGRRDRLPDSLVHVIEKWESLTKEWSETSLTVAVDYGGRDEIVRAVKKLDQQGFSASAVNEDILYTVLDTAGLPDPDLIIRTSGEQRLSGIMPWQSVYAELYFTPVHFPDFGVAELHDALLEFRNRKRRFGA